MTALDDILCAQYERVVGKDNCVFFENLMLQIPPDRQQHHCMKIKVKVLRYTVSTAMAYCVWWEWRSIAMSARALLTLSVQLTMTAI